MDKIGRYASDARRHDARLAFPPICDLDFLFRATREKPADSRGDSHIGVFCPRRPGIEKERAFGDRARQASRYRDATHSTGLIQQASRNREELTRKACDSARCSSARAREKRRPHLGEGIYPRNHGKRSLRPDEVFVTGTIRSKASSRRRHLLQEPREAKPSARGKPQLGRARSRGDPQIGKLAARKPSSRESRAASNITLRAPATPRSSGRTPTRR